MKNWLQFAAATMLVGCAAVGARDTAAPVPPSQPTPRQIVAARQAAFNLSGAAMGSMKAAIDGGGGIGGQAYAARGVARWAHALPTLFPDSTRGVTPTRARPEIFANRADFEAKAAAYAAAADRLAEAARSGDREAFTAAYAATGAACGACHQLYQAPAPQR